MTASDVIGLYTELQNAGIKVWVDGGWGVDALLGEQTRDHRDLDIAIQQKDVPELLKLLAERGYLEIKRESEWNFVLGDDRGREIDVHAFVFDAHGNIEKGIPYPPESLEGTGVIEGEQVRCISPDWMVKFHCGYPWQEKDLMDVSALCEKYGIVPPKECAEFRRTGNAPRPLRPR